MYDRRSSRLKEHIASAEWVIFVRTPSQNYRGFGAESLDDYVTSESRIISCLRQLCGHDRFSFLLISNKNNFLNKYKFNKKIITLENVVPFENAFINNFDSEKISGEDVFNLYQKFFEELFKLPQQYITSEKIQNTYELILSKTLATKLT
jgi:hypothetical protein